MLFFIFGAIGVFLAFVVSSSSGACLTSEDDSIPLLSDDDRLDYGSYESISCFNSDDTFISNDTTTFDMLDDLVVNPANGHIMIGGVGGIDDEGNTYGFDHNFDDAFSLQDSFDDSFSMQDDFDSMQDDFDSFQDFGFDDNF